MNLGSTLNLTAGAAWVGLTAMTGGSWENHDILSWSFSQAGNPEIVVFPSDTLDFGDVFIGFPDTMAVEVINTGFSADSLSITNIQWTGSGFTVDNQTFSLRYGESRPIPVVLDPAAIQEYTGTLTISSNDLSDPTVGIALVGQGLLPPDIVVTPDSLSDTLLTGASSVQQITIENAGDSDLLWKIALENMGLGTVTFIKEDYADWTLPENQDRITDNVWITRADREGIFNAATESDFTRSISPEGTEWAYGFTEELTPNHYTSWNNAVGGNPPAMVGKPMSVHLIADDLYFNLEFHSWTCCNNGGGFSYTRSDVRPVWLSVSMDSGVIAPGGSQQVDVTIDATGLDAGGHEAFILVHSNDPDEGLAAMPIHLDVTGAPDIYASVDTLDFGQVFVNYADTLELVMENKGTQDLLLPIVSASPSEYTVDPSFASIDPGETETFLVAMAPLAVGDYPGILTFSTNDPDEGTFVLPLAGVGVEPPIVGVSVDSLTADLFTNDTLQRFFSLENTGGSDLVYEIWATSVDSGSQAASLHHPVRTASSIRDTEETKDYLRNLLEDLRGERPEVGAKDDPVRPLAGSSSPPAGHPLWQLLYTDPDEPWPALDIRNVYGARTLDEILFKLDTHEPLTGTDYRSLVVVIDADQDIATGLDIDSEAGYGWQLGIDYLIAFWGGMGEYSGELRQYVATPYGWGWEEVDSLTTMLEDQENDEIIVGIDAQHFEAYPALNIAIEAYSGDDDHIPDLGAGHITFALSPPWLRLSTTGGIVPAGNQEEIRVTFDAQALFSGNYYADIQIVSNDPITPVEIFPTRLGVTGIPIYAGPDTVDFGTSFIGYADSTYLRIDNVGTETLEIGSIVSGAGQLSFTPSALSIPPLTGDTLVLYLLTETGGAFASTISFATNDANKPAVSLPVVSSLLVAPDIAVEPAELSFWDHEPPKLIDTIRVNNEGGSDLVCHIDIKDAGVESVTFTKADYADWTLAANQDRISDNVWITRGDNQGLFNAATESGYNWGYSPDDTEWAYGLTAELSPGDYQVWRDAVYGDPPGMVDQPISLHLISEDRYFDVMFHGWTCCNNGGGFSYTRTEAFPRWLEVNPEDEVVAAGSSVEFIVTATPENLGPGEYLADIIIASNDPDELAVIVAADLTLSGEHFPVDIAEHDNNNVTMSVFNNGVVGASRGQEGTGFQYAGLNGLFEGSLTIATIAGPDSLILGGLYQRDFTPMTLVQPIESTLPGFDQAFQSSFGDDFAPQPLSVTVVQRSHSKSTSPDDDYVIMEYVIYNDGTQNISDVYVGLGLDWEVGYYANNMGGYDVDRGMSYTYESGGGTNANYYGSVTLSGLISGHTLTVSGVRDDLEYYEAMTGFLDMPDTPLDCRSHLAVGPYDLPAGDSVQVAFAIVGGDNLSDLAANAATAQAVWATVAGADPLAGLPTEFALHQNYPNPFNPISTIQYDLPTGTNVILKVYDLLGREVVRLMDGYVEPGYHSITWNAKDQMGRDLPSGLYIARLVTQEFKKSIKMVLLK
ncbi:MAG: choice-of-anchor D domain-containing protein [Fidelibacterota bacterium]|nr:MAG: choice-of-anchor D domain-containing protein [Candidatus Neomarinimicrobiota bacterium]